MANGNRSGEKIAALAGKVLGNSNSSDIQKRFAASVLSQTGTGRMTGAGVEAQASAALRSSAASGTTKKLAASLVSQSDKKR